jgi:hypothetical protein
MPARRSIPNTLENQIACRWTQGESPAAIVGWINRTNRWRKKPVFTSPDSVERLLKRLSDGDDSHRHVAAVRRVRSDAPFLMDQLDTINSAFRESAEEALNLDSREEVARHTARLRALTAWERNCHRRLQLAGINGPSADALLEKWAKSAGIFRQTILNAGLAECEAEAAAAREAAGIAGPPGPTMPGFEPVVPPFNPEGGTPDPVEGSAENSPRFDSETTGETSTIEARSAQDAEAPPPQSDASAASNVPASDAPSADHEETGRRSSPKRRSSADRSQHHVQTGPIGNVCGLTEAGHPGCKVPPEAQPAEDAATSLTADAVVHSPGPA